MTTEELESVGKRHDDICNNFDTVYKTAPYRFEPYVVAMEQVVYKDVPAMIAYIEDLYKQLGSNDIQWIDTNNALSLSRESAIMRAEEYRGKYIRAMSVVQAVLAIPEHTSRNDEQFYERLGTATDLAKSLVSGQHQETTASDREQSLRIDLERLLDAVHAANYSPVWIADEIRKAHFPES